MELWLRKGTPYLWNMSRDHDLQLDSLPEDVRKRVMVFIASLMEEWEQRKQSEKSPQNSVGKPRVFGIAKGMATISKDFDAPLDDFKMYIQ